MKKHVILEQKDGTVKIAERDVLVGPAFSALMPDGGGKRAEVVPTTSVFDSRGEALAAATKDGKIVWVVVNNYKDLRFLKARVITRRRGINQSWKLIVQPVTESQSRKVGKAFEIHTSNALIFTEKMDALACVAGCLSREERRANEELHDAQARVKSLAVLRKLLKKSNPMLEP